MRRVLRQFRRSLRAQFLVYGTAAFLAVTVLSHLLYDRVERAVGHSHAHVVLLASLAVLLLLPLWAFLSRSVLGPVQRMVEADRVVLEGREGVILEERIPGSELGELMRSRNEMLLHLTALRTRAERSQREILRLKQLSDNILTSVPSALLVVDEALRVRSANRSFYELFGLTREETEGKAVGDLLPIPQLAELVRQVAQTGTPILNCETPFLSARGERILRVTATGMRIAEAEAEAEAEALLVIDDVTDQKLAEERLRQSEKLTTLGELLSGVAHELNNPLTTILGTAQLLRGEADVPKPVKERLGRIRDQAERTARIVKNLLTFARRSEPRRTQVRLREVLERTLDLLAYQLRVAGIEVVTEIAPDLPVISADPDQLQQVFVNLIKNAVDAMAGAAPPRTLTIRAAGAGAGVRLEFSDTGPGIPKAILWRIFEPFFTTKPSGQGTGLGLSICHGIVKAHGGEIHAESREGQGATFVVQLPVGTPVAHSEAGPGGQVRRRPAGRRILVADDEPEVLATLSEALASLGHRVDTAPGGRAVLEALASGRGYDLVILDLRMPDMDGRDLYEEISRRYPGLARWVVFTTGDVLSRTTRQFVEASGRPCLRKPFLLEDLDRLLAEMFTPEGAPGGGGGTV